MAPGDSELLARLEERVLGLRGELVQLRATLDTMARMIDRREESVGKRLDSLENFRSYLKPGLALLAMLGLWMATQVAGQMWAAAFSATRPPQAFPQLKAPTNIQERVP